MMVVVAAAVVAAVSLGSCVVFVRLRRRSNRHG